ncbi:hypothetical protein N7494_012171 [Penicillium frequentans]|uniref:Uncharacterized protein n=1 Tax=Penicillium frequentans TaxID=3151616 RepID=A0AAD6CL62_9EURO|nr:hypothetical protein N7494_012171 [Penicillium glabrum]
MDSGPRPHNEVAEESPPRISSPLSTSGDLLTMHFTAGSGTVTNSPVGPAQAKVETDADEDIDMNLTPSSSAPAARAQERAKFNEPTNLPREDQSLNDDQIIQVMYYAPAVRKNYTINFDRFGYLKTPWRKMLYEMDENGETRHPMPIIRSNVPGAECKVAGVRRRAQAAKNLEAKKETDALAKSVARENDQTKTLELQRKAVLNAVARTAKRFQEQSPDIQNDPKAKKPKRFSQPARLVGLRQVYNAETIASAGQSTIPTLKVPHTSAPPRQSAETIAPASLSTFPAPDASRPRTPLSAPRSSPVALAAVDDCLLEGVLDLFEDFIPTPPLQSNRNSPLNESSTTPGAQNTALPNEEIDETIRPQPHAEKDGASNILYASELLGMDLLLTSGRSKLTNWIDVQTRRLSHHLAGADSEKVNPEYQSRVTNMIMQMYQLRKACVKLNGVSPVESTLRAD